MNINDIKNNIGVNEVGVLSKLLTRPYSEVWAELKKRGAASVEVCALVATTLRAETEIQEQAKRYKYGFPKCFAYITSVDDLSALEELVSGARNARLEVYSCHLMGAEMYPEYLVECVPYMKKIKEQFGIANFVVSCFIDSVETAEKFLPYMEQAAKELAEDNITLCCHNHSKDSEELSNGKTAIEIVLEECPHVMLQFDIGWAWYGHQDPVKFIKKYGSRIASLHLKDFTGDARERDDDGRFTAIGYGEVSIEKCIKLMELCNLSEGMLIIDQDASDKDMYDEIEKGIEFVQNC